MGGEGGKTCDLLSVALVVMGESGLLKPAKMTAFSAEPPVMYSAPV
jgi:hypothetical protein